MNYELLGLLACCFFPCFCTSPLCFIARGSYGNCSKQVGIFCVVCLLPFSESLFCCSESQRKTPLAVALRNGERTFGEAALSTVNWIYGRYIVVFDSFFYSALKHRRTASCFSSIYWGKTPAIHS